MNELISNLSFEEYRELDGVNWSVLKNMDEPAIARHEMTVKRKQSDAMLLGSLVDAMVTTPDHVGRSFVQQPEGKEYDFRTAAGKAWKKEQIEQGLSPVNRNTWATAERMSESVLSLPEAKDLFGFGMPQVALQWEEKHGIQCRGLIDYVVSGRGFLELKTTSADSWEYFSKDCYYRKYFGQLAFYRRGLQACGRETKDIRLAVVRSKEPYLAQIFMPSYKMFEEGDKLVDNMLDIWNIYKDRPGDWKDTDHDTPVLDLPMWAYGY
tara:strand:+ start:3130 stop:3927 length:798 start_codon:yes stop_codon:yes gene_type:complete